MLVEFHFFSWKGENSLIFIDDCTKKVKSEPAIQKLKVCSAQPGKKTCSMASFALEEKVFFVQSKSFFLLQCCAVGPSWILPFSDSVQKHKPCHLSGIINLCNQFYRAWVVSGFLTQAVSPSHWIVFRRAVVTLLKNVSSVLFRKKKKKKTLWKGQFIQKHKQEKCPALLRGRVAMIRIGFVSDTN